MRKHKKALVVDDQKILGLVVERHLKAMGYSVVGVATTSAEAIDMALNYSPDIICMDINLNEKRDGIDTAKYLQRFLSFGLIYITGSTDRTTFLKAKLHTSFKDFLIKPLSFARLQQSIEVAEKEVTLADMEQPYPQIGVIG